MTLLIACLLLSILDASWGWYIPTFILWFFHIGVMSK